MPVTNYQLLKRNLDFLKADSWLPTDAKDDFFPDIVNFAEIKATPSDFVGRRDHRLLQIDQIPHGLERVPKRSGMLREAIWLHPNHRVVYLAILRHFIGKLDARLVSEVYSYRLDQTEYGLEYPFENKMDRWKQFQNDFRAAALSNPNHVVLVTDLASYYDHISCEQLCLRIRTLLGNSLNDVDEAVLELLKKLLDLWCVDGHGIPQNYDTSSFLGSIYLHAIDRQMIDAGYTYFRWVDDIRVVSQSKRDALEAMHYLQRILSKQRMFLATEKTNIHSFGDPAFNRIMDVQDDQILGQFQEIELAGDCSAIASMVDLLFERLEHHTRDGGDDRKFRAFGNRLLDIADYPSLFSLIYPRLEQFVLPRLETHPERSDYWVKFLAPNPSPAVFEALERYLIDEPSVFDWQRFHLWRLASSITANLPSRISSHAVHIGSDTVCLPVAAQAIVCAGRHGDNTTRENLFSRYFSSQRGYIIQRAVLVAIQELPVAMRESLYRRALAANTDLQELVEYLKNCTEPDYGSHVRSSKVCRDTPRPVAVIAPRGIGLVDGTVVTFSMSTIDFDYE